MDFLLPPAHFEPHRRRLTDLARWWLGNQAEAEDAVQDAYLRVRDSLPPGPGAAEAWLVTVVRNLCVDRLRRRGLEQREAAAQAATSVHAPSAEHVATLSLDAVAALRRIVSRLHAEDAAAVLLFTVFDFEHAEIARLSGQAESASRQRLHRALRRLRTPEHDKAGEAVEREGTDALLGLCWRALHTRSPAALMALLSRPAVSASGSMPASRHACGAPRTQTKLLQMNGHFALSIELDGVVLCALPLGPLASLADNESIA